MTAGISAYLRRTRKDDKSQYRDCDPELWEKLRDLVYRDARCTHCTELAGVLPDKTEYYNALLYYVPGMPRPMKQELRQHWLCEALKATAQAELVCVDPDNGITQETMMYREKGPKYVYLDDLRAIWERKQSLVIYHHLGMDKKAPEQMRRVVTRLQDGLEGNPDPIPLWFHRGTSRVFFVIPRPEHSPLIEDRVTRFLDNHWERKGHFERASLDPPAP